MLWTGAAPHWMSDEICFEGWGDVAHTCHILQLFFNVKNVKKLKSGLLWYEDLSLKEVKSFCIIYIYIYAMLTMKAAFIWSKDQYSKKL